MRSDGLYGLFMRRLLESKGKSKGDIIPFPNLFEKLCRNFSITKKECWGILFLLRDFGFIDVICGHGVRVLKKMD
ncbi:hypothetical protein GOV13_04260 [Candidatus Pacearchaeota archaeon]|nr:hypothetical protein [Candidatus Pacearchaeota archaeon]